MDVDNRRGKIYFESVVHRVLIRLFLAAVLIGWPFSYRFAPAQPSPALSLNLSVPQDYPGQKLKYDYMSTFLSRSTRPLGLKEDLMMKKLLRQPRASWATRAGIRHILD